MVCQAGGGVFRPRAAPSSISTPNTSSTTPQIRLMLMLSERWRAAPLTSAGDQQQRADEREHEADWPANIESHKFVPSFQFYQKMMFKMTQAMSSTVPTTAGRCQNGLVVVHDFRRERINQGLSIPRRSWCAAVASEITRVR